MATPFLGFLCCWWWTLLSFPAPLPGCCGAPVELCWGCLYLCSCFVAHVPSETWMCYPWECFLPVVLRYEVREKWYASERVCCYNNLQCVLSSCLFLMLVFCCFFTMGEFDYCCWFTGFVVFMFDSLYIFRAEWNVSKHFVQLSLFHTSVIVKLLRSLIFVVWNAASLCRVLLPYSVFHLLRD